MITIFKDIKGYEGKYQINEYGEVKSLKRKKGALMCKERMLKLETSNGYKRVTLSKNDTTKRFLVHRLVYQTFIGDLKKGMQIHHIDENKFNNHISNLMQVTPLENNHYSSVTKGFKLTEEKVREIRSRKLTVSEVVNNYGISPRHALRVINKERWKWVD
ncbi:NUMOD4 motif-containing HNH endonuclease [Staphylococcus rostri]|uniref:HNH endonuclease n=1 Tax=Staphylococcus delphini TaxID=53344 RepID=A0AAQ0D575_9STAP|nr:NUMOD4 motif-containing HNH endonuclease [Staphylococcus delphini]QUM67865.1 HNH endonuclease [Staphylococcus delphini]QUM68633.1 HNH endonuclease [Staphylococcus delphini]